MKNSGMGIASFIISILSGICIFILIIIAGVMQVSTPGGIDENSPQAVVVGLFLFLFLFLSLVSLGLGIAAMLQKDRKKVMAILGVIFSTIIVLGTIGLMILGSIAG